MANFSVNIIRAVNRLNKKLDFLQPVLEAITNSIESGSTNIKVRFETDDIVLEGMPKRINGFRVEDNGEGFTDKNRKAFVELWTDNKIDLGCKGVGRFTWLRVFEKVTIHSVIPSETVDIEFTTKFKGLEDIHITKTDAYVDEPSTTISFEMPTDKYYKLSKGKEKSVDLRPVADLDALYNTIEKNLMVKLYLAKEQGQRFSISIILDGQTKEITEDKLTKLEEKSFDIEDKNNTLYPFKLYYNFLDDGRNQKYMYYCANGRTVQKFTENVSFGAKLPNDSSAIMLLTSPYLDERVNDERNEFTLPISDNKPSIYDPLSFAQINEELKTEVQQIVLAKYPEIEKINEDVKQQAIEEAPYLAEYIKNDSSIIKDKNDIIKRAKKLFDDKKVQTNTKFASLLKKKNVDDKVFKNAVNEVSNVALAELGEYIFYRKNIIDALASAVDDQEKKEKFIHNIFMPMKTDDSGVPEETDKQYLSNLWLLDDKFMTYSYAASDKTVNQIKKAIIEKDEGKYKLAKRPDLIIFFNKDSNDYKDIVIAELKGANASLDEKVKSLTELPNNIEVVRKNIPESKGVWGYVITSIDEDFERSIKNQGTYSPLFCAGDDSKAYYFYNPALNAHITIIDLKTIVCDSMARNHTFLEILKK